VNRRGLAAATLAALLAACAGGRGTTLVPGGTEAAGARQAPSGKIQHVVVIVQENRSFDNLFHDYPGADTQSYGYTSTGKKLTLVPITLATHWDIAHNSAAYFDACDGTGSVPGTDCRMDGFDKETTTCSVFDPCPNKDPQYAYVPHGEIKPYFALANQYVLADRMFASNFDMSSFVSHQYIIAGQANSTVDYPTTGLWGCDGGPSDTIQTLTQQRTVGPSVPVCFDDQTLGDELDAAGVSWHYYTSNVRKDGGLWNAYQAIRHIRYGPDWKTDVVAPQTKFFGDVSKGRLPAVSWVTPTCANSDHASCGERHGPAWVASLVNAIGKSPYWNSTAIFIFWDDPGGWYDHVAPKLVDYDGLGMRVPMLIVSPYAKKGFVSHVHYEHGSILRFIEHQFGVAPLAATDVRATSPEKDCFDFTQAPRPFTPIPAKLGQAYFEREPLDSRPPDSQ
jgi:phospholipase C